VIAYPAAVGGTLTRVLAGGNAGAPTAVLVHGLGARADRWAHNIDALADAGYRVYAVDLPGHGFAAKGGGFDYSVPGFARFLAVFLETVGADKAVLVGTSLGGHTCAYFACEHPARVDKLVLVASTGLVPLGAERRQATRQRLSTTTAEGTAAKLAAVIHDPRLVTDDWVAEESLINSSPGAAESFQQLGEYFAIRLDDDIVAGRLAKLYQERAFPLCLVWGEMDTGFPVAMALSSREALGMPPLAIIHCAGHAPYLERPHAFNAALRHFLAGCPSCGSERNGEGTAGIAYY
jgi:2-hydroxy-6-oxonona-2,4-dienedioate hydrolase